MIEGQSFHPSFVLGFHGCDASFAKSLLLGNVKHLRPSKNDYDWLGSGIYFWEGSPARALQYARASINRPSPSQRQIRTPAVIGAIIELGHCLNMLDSQYFPVVRRAYKFFKKSIALHNLPIPRNRPLGKDPDRVLRDLDCAVINFIHEERRTEHLQPFDTVRAAFIEGQPLYKEANFFDKNHMQICVRNIRCIKGYFRPIF